MIRVVQANPAMDRIEVLGRLVVDGVNRSDETHAVAGGKGGNVARGVRALGERVAIYGFAGGPAGAFLRAAFCALGIDDRQTPIADETRVCTIIVERDLRRSTVLNEPGPVVTPSEARALVERLVSDCRAGDLVVLCGSVPRGVEPAFYGHIIEAVRDARVRVIVDARGEVLREALRARPWMAKANARELGEALGVPLEGRPQDEILQVMRQAIGRDLEVLAITLGERGAFMASGSGAWWARVPRIVAVNATGAGDLFLAGFTVALARGEDTLAALRLASACGLASVQSMLPELPPHADMAALVAMVHTEAV